MNALWLKSAKARSLGANLGSLVRSARRGRPGSDLANHLGSHLRRPGSWWALAEYNLYARYGVCRGGGTPGKFNTEGLYNTENTFDARATARLVWDGPPADALKPFANDDLDHVRRFRVRSLFAGASRDGGVVSRTDHYFRAAIQHYSRQNRHARGLERRTLDRVLAAISQDRQIGKDGEQQAWGHSRHLALGTQKGIRKGRPTRRAQAQGKEAVPPSVVACRIRVYCSLG